MYIKNKIDNKNYFKNIDRDIINNEINILLKKYDDTNRLNNKNLVLNKNIHNLQLNVKKNNKDTKILNNLYIGKNKERYFALLIHIYNISLWSEIKIYINNLINYGINLDIYVNISLNNEKSKYEEKYINLVNDIKTYKNYCITFSNNQGLDIGGFIKSYMEIKDMNLKYKNIIKIHTKTNKNWRFSMLYSLLGNKKIIENNIRIMENDYIGMIGNQKIEVNNIKLNSKKIYSLLNNYYNFFDIKKNYQGSFIPGTIFWIKGCILDKYFTKNNLIELYNQFPLGYPGQKYNNEELPHAFERFFGVFVENSKHVTFSYNEIK